MNPIVLSFADGTSFFVGLAVVLIAELLLLRFRKGLIRPVLTVLTLIGIIFVVISATPLPIWAYSLWFIPALASLVLGNLTKSLRYSRIIATGLLFVATTGLCLAEAPHHRFPRLTVPKGKRVYVLGDSISAGSLENNVLPAMPDRMPHVAAHISIIFCGPIMCAYPIFFIFSYKKIKFK